jgi:hypothetical protein
VPHVSGFQTRGILKWNLERDACHPSEWATYQPLVFHHVASYMRRVSGTQGYVTKLKVGKPIVVLITIHQDQWPEGIAGTQVARKLIFQGCPIIQTAISPRGYMLASEELWDERQVTPNHNCMPPQL